MSRKVLIIFILGIFITTVLYNCSRPERSDETVEPEEEVEATKIWPTDSTSGLILDDGFEMVRAHCTPCHSAKLVTQNRASREGWKKMIDWMQETQNLWDLGDSESIILDYLAKHYAPESKGRRSNLKDIEWYNLEEE
jgi:hypothetical protein